MKNWMQNKHGEAKKDGSGKKIESWEVEENKLLEVEKKQVLQINFLGVEKNVINNFFALLKSMCLVCLISAISDYQFFQDLAFPFSWCLVRDNKIRVEESQR